MNLFTNSLSLPALLRVLTRRLGTRLVCLQTTRLGLSLWLLVAGWAAPAAAQRVWTARTSTADIGWQSVTYGNGLFVAVGFEGSYGNNGVMTSPDGITWTARTPVANSARWASVTYGNGLFVAVGAGGNRLMTSPDGINWTLRTLSSSVSYDLTSVTYGNGRFVAVGEIAGTRVITSTNGTTWTLRNGAAPYNWKSVTYGNGLFVAVAPFNSSTFGSAMVMTSPDGATWTNRSVTTYSDWKSVTYGKGLFVALSDSFMMTSPDGITWTRRDNFPGSGWTSVTYSDGLFVAVGTKTDIYGNRVMTSLDGINWTGRPAAADNNWTSVTYGNGLFVAVGSSGTGNRVMTSPYDNSLPVTLRYFNGRMVAEGALLGWATAREANSSHFLIERSRDLVGFEAIANVPSRATGGNATTELTYQYVDAQPLPGTNYYRLVQVDLDGTRTPSRPVALSREDQPPVLYPNPVGTSGEAVLEPAVGYVRYQLTNLLGQVVQQADAPGTLSRISVAGQPAGLYLLHLDTSEGTRQTYRIVK